MLESRRNVCTTCVSLDFVDRDVQTKRERERRSTKGMRLLFEKDWIIRSLMRYGGVGREDGGRSSDKTICVCRIAAATSCTCFIFIIIRRVRKEAAAPKFYFRMHRSQRMGGSLACLAFVCNCAAEGKQMTLKIDTAAAIGCTAHTDVAKCSIKSKIKLVHCKFGCSVEAIHLSC